MVALACSDSNAPVANRRTYQLVFYGGTSLPVTLRRIVETPTLPGGRTTNCDDELTGSFLELRKTGQWTQTDSRLLVCDDGRADAASQEVLAGTYGTGADTLVLNADLGSGTHYLGLARVSGSSLTIYFRMPSGIGWRGFPDRTELVFRARE